MKPSVLAALGVVLLAFLWGVSRWTGSMASRRSSSLLQVLDEVTGQGVPLARVWVPRLSPDPGKPVRARPAKGGAFRVPDISGKVRLEACADGYAPRGLEIDTGTGTWKGELRLQPLGICNPMTSGEGRVALNALGVAEGWDLERGRPAGAGEADLLPWEKPSGGLGLAGGHGAGFLPIPVPEGRVAAWEFLSAVEAPAEGYRPEVEGWMCFVRTRHGRFGKLRLLPLEEGKKGIRFAWMFQPDGSRHLGAAFTGKLGGDR